MAGVNVELNANTQKYVDSIKKAQSQSNKSFDDIGKKAASMGDDITNAFESPAGAIQGFLGRLGPVGLAIGSVAAAATMGTSKLIAMGIEVAANQKELEKFAKSSGLAANEVTLYATAAASAGVSMEKFNDILKDTGEKFGEFRSTGGGGFTAYLDVVNGKLDRTADSFKGMSNMQILQKVMSDLNEVGASQSEIIYVFESIASDSSALTSMLGKNTKELENMLKGYATQKAIISQESMEAVNQAQHNMDMLQQNFSSMLTENFNGLIKLAAKTGKAISDAAAKSTESARRGNTSESYRSGEFKVDSKNYGDLISSKDAIRNDLINDELQKVRSEMSANERQGYAMAGKGDELNAKMLEEATKRAQSKIDEFEKVLAKAEDFKFANEINGTSSSVVAGQGGSTGNQSDVNKERQRLMEERKRMQIEEGRLMAEIRNTQGEETKKAYEGDLREQQSQLKKNQEAINALGEVQAELDKQRASKRLAALKYVATSEVEIAKNANDILLANIKNDYDEGLLSDSEYAIAKVNAAKDLATKLLDIEKKNADAKKKIMQDEHNARMADINTLKSFSTDKEEIANQEMLAKVAQVEHEYALDQLRKENSVLSLEDKNNKLAEIEREYEVAKTERETADMFDREQAKLLSAETERKTLLAQYEQGVIDKQEFDARIIESDKNVATATRDLAMKRLGTMSEMFKGAAALAKEGSKQQKALFAMEKASTIASMSLSMYEQWGKAKTWSDKAMVFATFVPQIASAAAVTIGGQFHDGTDYVEGTGSYYLQQGERVVNTDTNKDLTAYLKSNGSKDSGQTVINADLIIQGDASGMDEQKFKEYAMVHRDMISDAIRQSNMERGIS